MNHTAEFDKSLPLIAQLVCPQKTLEREKLAAIRETQAKERISIEEVLIRKGIATEHQIAAAYADYYLLPLFEPTEHSRTPNLAEWMPEKLCRDHLIVPVNVAGSTLDVAFFTPDALFIVEELQLLSGLTVRPMIARLSVIERMIAKTYDDRNTVAMDPEVATARFEEVVDGDEEEGDGEHGYADVIHLDQPPPPGRDGRIIRFVNQMFDQAFRSNASDVHIERFEDRCRVRVRIDGRLCEIAPPPLSMYVPVVARIKVLAKMDIAEKRVPQDGAIAFLYADKRVDVRASTVPTVHGEKVVLRILDKTAVPLKLDELGFDARQASDLTESINMPHGLMLVTGPTGSGKSTTLYTCLRLLNQPHTNICTVEDPVEYKFTGINQIQTKNQVGLTFASALRAFLRQDPDIIMVGEVRDAETADICLRAALTGHLVLSTLHTNDALAAVTRLQDMGIEPFLLASTLRVLVAQRLIRRLCPNCKQPYHLDLQTSRRIGLSADETIYRPVGCNECSATGYRGRLGVFEVIRITQDIAELIQSQAPLTKLRQCAAANGMKLLAESGLEKVRDGSTSLEEVLSITISDETHRVPGSKSNTEPH